MLRVLAVVPYHLDFCAGQRFRIELWAKELAKRGIEVEFLPFTNKELTDVLYQPNRNLKKATMLLTQFAGQFSRALTAKRPDVIFIYREAALIGPAIIERILRRQRVPIVYDIDEPLFVPYLSPSNGRLNKLKFFSKVDELFKLSDCVFAVNSPIAEYAKKFNQNVEIVPMTVDVNRYAPRKTESKNVKPVIAWVGTRTNQPMIELAVPALRALKTQRDFSFRIIADDEMQFEGLEVDFIPWSYDTEIENLQNADIGIVPVKENDWSPWKFFFKTIQFMSLGLPVVASATGSNVEIIEDGVNGFLVETESEWVEKLQLLMENPQLRANLGAGARKTILERFDIRDQFDFIEKKFRSLAEGNVSQPLEAKVRFS